jgi:hypothetical protein
MSSEPQSAQPPTGDAPPAAEQKRVEQALDRIS